MKITQYRFKDKIEIVNLGDLHRGDKCCDAKTFYRVRDYIKDNPSCYWVSTGDLLNVATKHSKSDVYSSLSVQEEMELFIDDIHPIREKCLGIVSSNHHDRISREVGMDLDAILCKLTDMPYLGHMGLIDVTLEKDGFPASYFIVLHHGVAGGSTVGAKLNDLSRTETVVASADIYMQGHTHQYGTFREVQQIIDRKRKLLQPITSHFVTTGHYLGWDGSYGQAKKMRPKPIGSSIATIYPTKRGRHEEKRVSVDFLN